MYAKGQTPRRGVRRVVGEYAAARLTAALSANETAPGVADSKSPARKLEGQAAPQLTESRASRLPVGELTQHGIALAAYIAAAAYIYHRAVLHMGSVCACQASADPSQFVWALEWYPHALLHSLNPFYTHAMFAPGGMVVNAGTTIPLAAIIVSPVTWLLGPIFSYNVLLLAGPAISAWTCYLLCKYLSRSFYAALAGGFVYGFSVYELNQNLGHTHVTLVMLPPLAALLTIRYVRGQISSRWFVAAMAAVIGAQLLTSSEVLFTMTLAGSVVLATAWLVGSPQQRGRVVLSVGLLAVAFALVVVVCAWVIYWSIRAPAYSKGSFSAYPTDLLEYLIPPPSVLLGATDFAPVSATFTGMFGPPVDWSENGAYLGLPLIIVLGVYCARSWGQRQTKILAIGTAVVGLLALGTHLIIAGQKTIWLPGSLVQHLPGFTELLPLRLALFTSLGAAVGLAMWVATPSTRRVQWLKWAVAVLAVVFVIPNISMFGRTTEWINPPFFQTNEYKKYLRRNAVILPIPFAYEGTSTLWQADTHMYFSMASGYFGYPPMSYTKYRAVNELLGPTPPPATAAKDLRRFIAAKHIDDVILQPDTTAAAAWMPVLADLSLKKSSLGGVVVYRVRQSQRLTHAAARLNHG